MMKRKIGIKRLQKNSKRLLRKFASFVLLYWSYFYSFSIGLNSLRLPIKSFFCKKSLTVLSCSLIGQNESFATFFDTYSLGIWRLYSWITGRRMDFGGAVDCKSQDMELVVRHFRLADVSYSDLQKYSRK